MKPFNPLSPAEPVDALAADAPRVTAARVGGGVLVAALVGAAVWGWLAPPPEPAAPAAGLGFPTDWVSAGGRVPPREAVGVSAKAMAAGLPALAPAPLCGLPQAAASAASPPGALWTPARVAAAAEARERLRAAFLLSSDEVARAAAHLLPRVDLKVPTPALATDAALEQARQVEAQLQAQALARSALGSHSPLVYGLAWKTCQTTHQGPTRDANQSSACQMLSIDQWARLEPSNAVPWFELAAQAHERGDLAAVDEAMFRAAKGKSVDAGFGQLAALVFTHAPREVSLLDAWTASGELTAWNASWSLMPYRMASLYCEPQKLADANRRQQCADLAELFVQRGRSLMDLAVAHSLGQRVGWTAPRLDALGLEREALTAVLWQQRPALAQSQADCATLERERQHLVSVAERGELALARERLMQSGRSTQAWAQERRAMAPAAAASAVRLIEAADAAASSAERRQAS